ncbi:MAG TPA: hypothetical protein VGP81_07325, partial [Pyrinomonadaceae bacterium]|nr:hypothetical protein [Pyrinomonadaceae bacterium]
MQLFDPNNPNEKKKIIAAVVLGVVAIGVLGYLFFGGGTKKPTPNANQIAARPTPNVVRNASNQPPPEMPPEEVLTVQPIVYNGVVAAGSEGDRNIFAYYVPPPAPVKIPPTPTPPPPPPLTVSSVTPTSVYARTADFSLQVGGDKFTPAVRIFIDGRQMQTRFISAQQLATTVTADLIANPGNRRIEVKTADGSLFSNTGNLVVTPPPVPNYSYIGLIGKPRFNDTAVLQDKNSKDLLNVQRGDVVAGRFRVNSISDK